jgi:Fasciclin domain
MKKLIKSMITAAFVAILLATFGCKENYYDDGGISDSNVGVLGVSTMQYLENHKESFDTLVSLIKLCNLQDAVNAQGATFLAPQDYSIRNYFKLIFADLDAWPSSLSGISADEMARISGILKNYIVPNEKIVRSGLKTSYSYVTTSGGRSARFNLMQEDYLGNVDKGASYIVFSLNTSDSDKAKFQSVQVATADLQSTTGIIHVLDSSSHIFGFN